MIIKAAGSIPSLAAEHAANDLGPGLHWALVANPARAPVDADEPTEPPKFEVTVQGGALHNATLNAHCEVALVQECVRLGRPVLVQATADGIEIVGAIQTQASPMVMHGDAAEANARELKLSGAESVRIKAGRAALTLHADGRIELQGDGAVFDLSQALRVLSAKVELP